MWVYTEGVGDVHAQHSVIGYVHFGIDSYCDYMQKISKISFGLLLCMYSMSKRCKQFTTNVIWLCLASSAHVMPDKYLWIGRQMCFSICLLLLWHSYSTQSQRPTGSLVAVLGVQFHHWPTHLLQSCMFHSDGRQANEWWHSNLCHP